MTENVILALIICGTIGSVILGMTTVIAVGAYSREIAAAWRAWRDRHDED